MAADVSALVVSLVLLSYCGDRFVLALSRFASETNVRPIVLGTVLGGLGASLPELIVVAVASFRGEPGLALGSIVGSNVVNVGLGLALAAFAAPVLVESRTLRREIPVCALGVLLLALAAFRGVSKLEGVVLSAALLAAIAVLLINAERAPPGDELEVEAGRFLQGERSGSAELSPVARAQGAIVLLSVIGMILGAEALVRSASAVADRLGIGRGVVGLTIVAIGTSVPVVVIAVQAARRGHHDLVVGNVFGSDLFIALAGGGTLGLIRGGAEASVGSGPVLCMCAVTLAGWAFMARGKVLDRREAAILVAGFVATMALASR